MGHSERRVHLDMAGNGEERGIQAASVPGGGAGEQESVAAGVRELKRHECRAPAELARMDRRSAIKWMIAASASVSVLRTTGAAAGVAGTGYGTDPRLLEAYKAGDFWPLTLTEAQRRTVAALCDTIIPADDVSPSASQVRVPDFIDEWISAPYPRQKADRKQILEGLKWLEAESAKRFHKSFVDLEDKQKRAICDEISYLPAAKPELKQAAAFFAKFRDLTAGGFYTTAEGMNDIKYVGNIALERFDGPPPEVLHYLKLDQP